MNEPTVLLTVNIHVFRYGTALLLGEWGGKSRDDLCNFYHSYPFCMLFGTAIPNSLRSLLYTCFVQK